MKRLFHLIIMFGLLAMSLPLCAQDPFYDDSYQDGFYPGSDNISIWKHTYKTPITKDAFIEVLSSNDWNDSFSDYSFEDGWLIFNMSDFYMDVSLTDHAFRGLIPVFFGSSGLFGKVRVLFKDNSYTVFLSNIYFKSNYKVYSIESCAENPAFPELFDLNFKKLFDINSQKPSIVGSWHLEKLEIVVDGKVTGSSDGDDEYVVFTQLKKCVFTKSNLNKQYYSYDPKTKALIIGRGNGIEEKKIVTKLTAKDLIWEGKTGNAIFRYTLKRVPHSEVR